MASRLPFGCFFFILSLFHLISAEYFLPLLKDDNVKTTQFYTTLAIGTPAVGINLVVDLGNQFSWFACDIVGYNHSSTYKVIPCGAPQCPSGSPCISCNGPPTPSCNNNSCGAYAYTPWSDALYSSGLVVDTFFLSSAKPRFPFACADSGPLKGLSRLTKGVLTLARTPMSLNERVSSSLKLPRKFALCPPSTTSGKGAIYFGGGPYSKSLVTTALVVNPHSTSPIWSTGDTSVEYFINVRSIKIDATPLKFNASLLTFDKDGKGGTKISTLDSYTTLHSQIYKPFVDLFVAKAAALKLAKVATVAPFGACFSSKSVRYNAKTGKGLPIIDLVLNEKSVLLHGKNARWRIYGSNSMVTVSRDVQCLGFVDGGAAMTPIAIGAKQLEDNLVEFDLEGKKLAFTSSLLRFGTTCSNLVKGP